MTVLVDVCEGSYADAEDLEVFRSRPEPEGKHQRMNSPRELPTPKAALPKTETRPFRNDFQVPSLPTLATSSIRILISTMQTLMSPTRALHFLDAATPALARPPSPKSWRGIRGNPDL